MVYYAETNIIAIVVAVVLLLQGRRITSKHETSQIMMTIMLWLLVVISLSDIAAYYFRGKAYLGVEIANTCYFLAMAVGTYFWFLFILIKMGYATNLKKAYIRTGIPMGVLCVLLILNFATNFFFTVDAEHYYHRGPGVYLTWIIEWAYVLIALIINIKGIVGESSSYRKREYRGYLLFCIPIFAAAICQMLFYGTTTTQIGYMIALLMAYINNQYYQVQRDELTGINNKNAFLHYQESVMASPNAVDLTVSLIDVDHFKKINDTYGHLKGDQALKDVATALKNALAANPHLRTVLFRYGGDEFVIIGRNMTASESQELKESIKQEIHLINENNRKLGEQYELSLSIGFSREFCNTIEEFNSLMKRADEEMYRIKHQNA